ncbi:phosphohydrolase [Bacillus sp. UMB0899]|nr:phosphohydrolase [Bacillus sp. UMB0899]
MKIHITQLQEGCILTDHVLSATNRPLAYKNTIINKHLKDVLQAFLVKEVQVASVLENGKEFRPSFFEEDQVTDISKEEVIHKTFYQQYLQSVQAYKQLFINWQSGGLLDIHKVRQIIIPLVPNIVHNDEDVFKLYHYCQQEDYVFHHSISVALVSAYLAKKLGYQQGEVNQIALTGLLCDCGMAKVNPNILKKKLTLTESEYKDIKQHPVHSYNMLKNIMSIKEGVKMGVLQHHERIDGSGYPLNVRESQLHPYSKIVALADTYQAMVSIRPYRSKQSPFKVLEQIMEDDFGKFDITIINELKKGITRFSSGTKVRLSNGLDAEIIFIDDHNPTRPMVKCLFTEEIIALKDRREMFVEEII